MGSFWRSADARRWRRVAIGVCLAPVLVLGGLAAGLIYPGVPGPARSLRFDGYRVLPKGPALSILDYLTISGGDVFVTGVSSGVIYKIALNRSHAAPISTLQGPPAPHGVALDPVSGLAYATRSEVNTVDVFDPATMRLVKRVSVADDPDAIFYDPGNRLILVDSGDAKAATLIDPKLRTVVGSIPLGGEPEFAAYDAQTKVFYQNLKDTNSIAVVDIARRAVVARWPLDGCPGPSGMAIDTAGRRLFVACSGNARLVIVSLVTHRVTDWLPIGGGPDSVGYDPGLHRLYTTGRSGVLTVIQQDSPDSYRRLDQINLHFGAHTLAVDPSIHTLYVGYASVLLPARLAVFTPLMEAAR